MTLFIVYWSHLLEHMKLYGVSVTGKGCSLQNTAGSHCGPTPPHPTPTRQTLVQLLRLHAFAWSPFHSFSFYTAGNETILLTIGTNILSSSFVSCCERTLSRMSSRTDINATTLHYDLFGFLWCNHVYHSLSWMDGFHYTCTYLCSLVAGKQSRMCNTVTISYLSVFSSPSRVAFSLTLLQMWPHRAQPLQCILCDSSPI